MDAASKFVKSLLRLLPGRRAEVYLSHMLSPWFSEYWVFPNPMFRGNEIADAILIWGDVAFLIQIKSREGIHSSVDWGKRKVKIEKERINKWAALLKTESISLKNKFRKIPFPKEDIKSYYGLIVLNHLSEPYEIKDIPPEDDKVAIQAISLLDLNDLLRFINTPWDLVIYFESRWRLSQIAPVKVHNENEVFWLNLELIRREMSKDKSAAEAQKYYDFFSLAVQTVDKELQLDDPRLRNYAASYLIDASIGGQLIKASRDEKGNYVLDGKFILLTKAIEVLTEMSRLRRAFYGSMFLEQAEKARASGEVEYKTGRSPKREILYGFIVTDEVGQDLKDLLGAIAAKTLVENSLYEGIFIAAPAQNILRVYEEIESWFLKDRKEQNEFDTIEILQSTLLYINLKKIEKNS